MMFNGAKAVSLNWLAQTSLTNLNSGEGGSNFIDVKKYEVDGIPYPYVSGQAMRHYLKEAIRRMNDFDCSCVPDENGETCGEIANCAHCDLFGFMQASTKSRVRVSPVKVSPAMGLLPFEDNSTVDFLTRRHRVTSESEKLEGDIVNVELGVNVYRGGISVDLLRLGRVEKYDDDDEKVVFEQLTEDEAIQHRLKDLLEAVISISDYSKQARLLSDFTPDLLIAAVQDRYSHRLQKALALDNEGRIQLDRLAAVLKDVKRTCAAIYAGLLPGVFEDEDEIRGLLADNDVEVTTPGGVIDRVEEQLQL
jgi:CRISPR-associated protein Cst2